MLDLVIITGASRGIGLNIACDIAPACKDLIIIGSSDSIFSTGITNAHSFKLNLKHYNGVWKQISNYALFNFSNVKSLGIVLCGAQIGTYGGLLDANLSEWGDLYSVNVLGNLSVVQAVMPLMPECKTRIAFFAGGGAAYGYPDFSGYALTKVATVRAVENLGMEFDKLGYDASIIAVAPGSVATDMQAVVKAHGAVIKTQTDISEPTNFVHKFLLDEVDSKTLNGKFLHVRDDIASVDFSTANSELFKLRRVQ